MDEKCRFCDRCQNCGGYTVPRGQQILCDCREQKNGIAIENTPRGFRDLYWCWIINEPEIALGDGTCPGCKCSAVDVKDRHTFLGHVRKY